MQHSQAPDNPLDVQVGGGHYKSKAIQPIEYCMANNLNACESAVVKHITRWADKGGVQDLQKIKHYVDLLIQLDPRAKPPAPTQVTPAERAALNELSFRLGLEGTPSTVNYAFDPKPFLRELKVQPNAFRADMSQRVGQAYSANQATLDSLDVALKDD